MIDDQRFAAGDQWPDDVKTMRAGRPMQTINRLPAFIDQIIGDASEQRLPSKVFAGEDGDVEVAKIYSGLIRSIENRSNADFAYDTALSRRQHLDLAHGVSKPDMLTTILSTRKS